MMVLPGRASIAVAGISPTVQSGLGSTSYVQCELIRSVNIDRLVRRLGTVGVAASAHVAQILRTLLGY